MWNDKISERFWWHHAQSAFEQLSDELAKAEDEEEVGLYLLNLHLKNHHDFQCFSAQEEEVVKKLLVYLIEESIRHRELLSKIVSEVKSMRSRHVP